MEYLKKLGVTERAEIAAHLTEVKEDYNEEVFNTLILNISNTSLKRKLHRDYNKDGHKAYMHIAERWDVTVNDSRPASIAQERKEHVEAGHTKITLDAVTAYVDKLTTYNTQLASTPYKQEGALDVIAILDAMAAVDGDFVSTFKITNVAILTDFDKTYDLLKKLLEERDRTKGGSDSDWSVIRSMSGWGFAFVGGIVAWGAKKQPSIALSTMEAEICLLYTSPSPRDRG